MPAVLRRYLLLAAMTAAIVVGGYASPPHSTPAAAQTDPQCTQLVRDAMRRIGSVCADLGRNEACYGNQQVAALDLDGQTVPNFARVGDRAALDALSVIGTQPYDPATGEWGVALLRVQANLPETTDDVMTYVLLGDTQMLDASSLLSPPPFACTATNTSDFAINVRSGPTTDDRVLQQIAQGESLMATGQTANDWLQVQLDDQRAYVSAGFFAVSCSEGSLPNVDANAAATPNPMSVVALRTGQAPTCSGAPNGLLVESPEGQQTRVNINGVEMLFASTGFITADAAGALAITGIDGEIVVNVPDDSPALAFPAGPGRDEVLSAATGDEQTEAPASEAREEMDAPAEAAAEGPDDGGSGADAIAVPMTMRVGPGQVARVDVSAAGVMQPPRLETATLDMIVPVISDVIANNTDFDTALLQAGGVDALPESMLEVAQCALGETYDLDLTLPPSETRPLVSVEYVDGNAGIIRVNRTDNAVLRVGCQTIGTQVVVISALGDSGDRTLRAVRFIVTVPLPQTLSSPTPPPPDVPPDADPG